MVRTFCPVAIPSLRGQAFDAAPIAERLAAWFMQPAGRLRASSTGESTVDRAEKKELVTELNDIFSKTSVVVVAHYSAYFIDAGTKRHNIVPKKAKGLYFTDGGRTVFTKKVDHPRTAAKPFRARTAREALRRKPLGDALINEWNKGA